MGIVGTLILPGDKSISHRALMLASISNKKSKLINLSTGKDVSSTISCLKNCGIEINKNGKDITIQGGTLRDPKNVLDCGNSGTTIRLLAGLLAGQGINATLVGDKSLSKRPMRRIIDPLMKMGVKISSKNNFAPITIEQSKMNPINYHSPIASAQVKSCILFAGMGVQGLTQINEPFQSRDHSEIMLQHLGASINVSKDGVSISKSDIQNPIDLTIPSDSFLRKSEFTQGASGSGANSGIVTSGLNVGDFFIVSNSNVGHGLTSLNTDGSAVGVGTTYIDNVYRVAHRTLGVTTDAMGFGSTVVTQVVVSVNSLNGLSGLGHSMYFGDYSYGRLQLSDRNTVRSYPVNTSNGVTGILTGPIIKRQSFLKTQSYST